MSWKLTIINYITISIDRNQGWLGTLFFICKIKKIIFNLHLNSYFVDQFFMSADSSMLKGEHLNRNMFDIWTMNRVFLGEQPTFSYWTRTVKLFVITDATMMSWQ